MKNLFAIKRLEYIIKRIENMRELETIDDVAWGELQKARKHIDLLVEQLKKEE